LGFHGVPNDLGIGPRIFGSLLGLLIVIYALGEEIGWRGFMHDRLANRAIWLRAVIISVPWYLWHLPFSGGEFEFLVALKAYGVILLAALIL